MVLLSPLVFLAGTAMVKYNIPYCYCVYGNAGLFTAIILLQLFINWISKPKVVYSKELSRKEEEVIIMSTD